METYQDAEVHVLQDVLFPVQASEWDEIVASYTDSLGVQPEYAHKPTCQGDSTAVFRLPAYSLSLIKVPDGQAAPIDGKPKNLALYTEVAPKDAVKTVYELLANKTPGLGIVAKNPSRTAVLYLGKDAKTGEPRTVEITLASVVVKFKTVSLLGRSEVEMGAVSHNPNYPGVSQEAAEKGAAAAPQPAPAPAPAVESPKPVEQE